MSRLPSRRRGALLVFLVGILPPVLVAQDASLVLHFPFDDAGSTAQDLSANANDGVIEGDPQSVQGMFGAALMFDATDDQVVVPGNPTLDIQDQITMAAWIRPGPNLTADWRTIMGKSPTSVLGQTTFSYDIRTDNTGILRFSLNIGGWQYILGPTLVEDTWYHVVGTYDGAELVLYLDGETIATTAASGQINVTADPFCVGNIVNAAGSSNNEYWSGVIDEVALWNRAISESEVKRIMTSGLTPAGPALAPSPDDGATDVPRDAILSWTAGPFAQTHDVYFGTTFDDVNAASRDNSLDVLLSEGQTALTYDAGRLEFGRTYYWRVDEVNAAPDNTIFNGSVWSFTVEPLAYPIADITATSNGASKAGEGPENVVNGSGLDVDDQHSTAIDAMWAATATGAEPLYIQFEFDRIHKLHEMLVWNYNSAFELLLGFGLKDATVEYSTDGTEWAVLGDVEFAQGTALEMYAANTTLDLEGLAARFVKLTVKSGHGMMGQFGLSEVRFLHIPVQAREPQPGDGATGVAPDTALSWRAGREAAVHEVYLGTDPSNVSLLGTSAEAALKPDVLEFGTTYSWRINEVNEAEVPTAWEGDLWTFSTLEYAVIEDFENYDDDADRIFDTWIDGFINGTGSTVGYFEAPFAETTIVNSGSQSMPLEYANDASPFYSEAEYDLGGMDLDTNGADTLRLFVTGQAPAFIETADGSILMNAIGNDIWGSADQFRFAYRQITGDGSMTARVDYLDGSPNPWAKGGVMIRQSTEPGSTNTYMAMTGTDGGGATYQQRMEADAASVSQHTYADGPFAEPYWVRVTREGDKLQGFTSPDGENWTQRGEVVTLAMTDPVLIGLALTSHNVNQATSAEFSNVSFTGNVSANWEMAEIGATQPVGNDPAPLYVALEDNSGNVVVVPHPDENIVGKSGWAEWLVPYSNLAGINLNRVTKIMVGVGDRDNPTADGTGLIFIDDIGYGKPAAVE